MSMRTGVPRGRGWRGGPDSISYESVFCVPYMAVGAGVGVEEMGSNQQNQTMSRTILDKGKYEEDKM